MAREVVAHVFLADEGAQLDVLGDDLLAARPVVGDEFVEQGLGDLALGGGLEDAFFHLGAALLAQAVHEAEPGDLGGVGDEAEDGVAPVVIDGLEHLVGEAAAEGLALAVDVEVVAAREVDALEGARGAGQGGGELGGGDATVALHHDHMAGRHLLHLRGGEVEDGLQRGALGSEGDDLVVLEIKRGADAGGIARDEGVAVADEAAERVTAVPLRGGAGDDAAEVEAFADLVGDVLALQALLAEAAVDVVVLLIEEEADFLQQGLRVGREDRVLAHADERLVQLLGVGHVEVAAEREVARRPGRTAEIRVTRGDVVTARGAVAQVADEQLASEIEVFFDRVGELGVDLAGGLLLFVLGEQDLEDFVERVGLHAALAKHERIARRDVEFHAGHARAVLAAVVLLFHEEEELGETPERRAVFFLVVGEGLQEPDQRYAAFVGDLVGHG